MGNLGSRSAGMRAHPVEGSGLVCDQWAADGSSLGTVCHCGMYGSTPHQAGYQRLRCRGIPVSHNAVRLCPQLLQAQLACENDVVLLEVSETEWGSGTY